MIRSYIKSAILNIEVDACFFKTHLVRALSIDGAVSKGLNINYCIYLCCPVGLDPWLTSNFIDICLQQLKVDPLHHSGTIQRYITSWLLRFKILGDVKTHCYLDKKLFLCDLYTAPFKKPTCLSCRVKIKERESLMAMKQIYLYMKFKK